MAHCDRICEKGPSIPHFEICLLQRSVFLPHMCGLNQMCFSEETLLQHRRRNSVLGLYHQGVTGRSSRQIFGHYYEGMYHEMEGASDF